MKRMIITCMTLLLMHYALEARVVLGQVLSGKEKLADVIVTDGTNFTRTNKKGKFTFDIQDDAEFVYIVTPAGYSADWSSGVPVFYQPAAGTDRFVFNLKKTGTCEDYSIVAVADPQTKNRKHFDQFAAEPMADLCKTAAELGSSAVGLVLGDICWDSLDLIEPYKKEIVRTGIPFYPVVGNHDHEKEAKGDKETTATYRKLMGPENYAFCLGRDVVIVLDNIIYDTEKKYQNGYAPEILAWVEGLVPLLNDDASIYVAQHAPVKVWDKNINAVNVDKLVELIKPHDCLFLSGHTHINNYLVYDNGTVEHNIASLCGSWWDTIHCTDGTPRGYKVFTKHNGNLSWYYKSVDYPKDYQFQIFDKGESKLFPDSYLINIWDWDPEWKVSWYEDGEYKGELANVTAHSPQYRKEISSTFAAGGEGTPKFKKSRKNYHYFAVTPGEDAKVIKIRIQNRFGQVWEQEIKCR